jgi:AraC-like DNA-binding protein
MTSTPSDFATVRFSTSDWAEPDRLAVWKEEIGRTVFTADMAPLSDGPFHADTMMRALPGLGIVFGTVANLQVTRTREHEVLDSGDDFILSMTTSGVRVVSQCGREQTLRAGDACLLSHVEPGMVTFSSLSRFIGLRLPRRTLAPLVSNLDDAVMRPVPRDTEALRLLARYITELDDGYQLATPELRRVVVTHIHDLVALVVGATGDATALAEGRGVRAARLAAIKADIIANLGRRSLTVDVVAARHRLTPRHLQRLFETEGMTFSEFVLSQRLIRAHRMLADPRFADHTISTIAFEVGFGDLSYFNRTFRRLYGAAPSDVRVAASRQRP